MRIWAGLAIALGLAAAAFGGQIGFGREGFGNVVFPGTGRAPVGFQPGFGRQGFGNVVFPGTGRGPATNSFSITNPGFANRLGATVGGFRGGFANPAQNRNFVYVPFAYPVYTGGYYPSYPDQSQPNVMVVYPQQAAPVTIINQIPSPAPVQQTAPPEGSGMESYEAPAATPAPTAAESSASSDNYYLIALKDHSIYPAVAYWVEGDTLHYFTKGNVHNQASLALVDKPLTERLNRERDITVHLP